MGFVYKASKTDLDRVENNFTYHVPVEDQPERYVTIRNYGKMFALSLLQNCPASRELSLALSNLEQAVMWANAAIARNEPNDREKVEVLEPTDVPVSE